MDIPRIDSELVNDAGKDIINSVKERVATGEIQSLEELRSEIFTQYIKYFKTLGSNPYNPVKYGKYEHKNPDVYNANQAGIDKSLELLFRESRDLNASLVSQFTLMNESSEDLIGKIKSVTSNIDTLRNQIERRQFLSAGQSVVTISDTFTDATKIDFDKSDINIDFQSSYVSLPVEANTDRGVNVDDVTIINVNKDTDGTVIYEEDKLPSDPKAYEGFRYATPQGSRPEGGNWRIETKNTTIDTANPTLNFDENYTSLAKDAFFSDEGGDKESLVEFGTGTSLTVNDPKSETPPKRITPTEFFLDDPESASSVTNWDQPYGSTLTRQDMNFVEIKATEEQMNEKRLDMFDGDPRTFWEIEYTPVIPNLEAALNVASDANSDSYADYQLIAQEYLRQNSADYLEATIRIELDNVYSLNYIDLTPVFFTNADDANYEVLEILTQPEENGIQEGIPNFESYDNIIGRTSNDTITRENMSQSNTFNKFGFKGKGIWTFPKRKVKIITVKIKQDYAIPNPYILKNVQLLKKTSYSINESKSAAQNSQSGFTTNTDSNSQSVNALERGRTTRMVQFGYLETVASDLQNDSTGLLAGATSAASSTVTESSANDNSRSQNTGGVFGTIGSSIGGSVAGISGSTDGGVTVTSAVAGAAIAAAGVALDSLLSNSSGGSSSSNSSQQFNDSGFLVNSEYYRTLWSRARYAIGIADIGLFSRVYKQVGTLTSKPSTIYNGNKELTLSVNEKIPTEFLEFDPNTAFIEYWIYINDVPHRINPIMGTVRAAGHTDFPSKIVLDREVDSELVTIRMVAKVFRPLESQLLNAESETPILNGYEIKIIDL